MCLMTVEQGGPYRADLYREGTGWKVYQKSSSGELEPLFRARMRNCEPGKGKIDSNEYIQPYHGWKQYTAGFHLFMNREDAENMVLHSASLWSAERVICRVKWRGLCAIGTEAAGQKVLVVYEILSREVVKAE